LTPTRSGDYNGVEWLLKNHPQLIDADFGSTKAGWRDPRRQELFNAVQASEKVYQSFLLEVKNKGGTARGRERQRDLISSPPPCSVSPRLTSRSTSTKSRGPISSACQRSNRAKPRLAMKGVIQNPPDAHGVAYLENVPAYNATMRTLRGDEARSGARRKRAAADGARDGQLPHPADRDCRNDARDSGQSRQR